MALCFYSTEPQVRSICNHVRPDRQTLLFSATFKKRIEKLARDVLTDPVKIVQGDIGEANEDVKQHMFVFNNPLHKWNWLLSKMVEFLSCGSVLIFVTKKAEAEIVATNLQVQQYDVVLLHGDIEQAERNKVITKFKKRDVDIMVATDVAARGLDIPHIRTVVNYDIARDIDTHTHRIGRTGRAGEKGDAYTLVTDKDKEFAGHLVRNLEGANQEVPDDLLELAMQSSWFRNSRFKSGKGKTLAIGGCGLGYKERPGLGGGSGAGSGGASSRPSPSSGNNYSSGPAPPPPSTGPVPSSSSSRSGPATNRFSAMKEAFRSQYNSQVYAEAHAFLSIFIQLSINISFLYLLISSEHQPIEHGRKLYRKREFLWHHHCLHRPAITVIQRMMHENQKRADGIKSNDRVIPFEE